MSDGPRAAVLRVLESAVEGHWIREVLDKHGIASEVHEYQSSADYGTGYQGFGEVRVNALALASARELLAAAKVAMSAEERLCPSCGLTLASDAIDCPACALAADGDVRCSLEVDLKRLGDPNLSPTEIAEVLSRLAPTATSTDALIRGVAEAVRHLDHVTLGAVYDRSRGEGRELALSVVAFRGADAQDVLTTRLDREIGGAAWRALVEALATVGTPRALGALNACVGATDDEDCRRRLLSCTATILGQTSPPWPAAPREVRHLAELVWLADARDAVRLLELVEQAGDPGLEAMLVELLSDSNYQIKVAAARALRTCGTGRAAAALEEAAGAPFTQRRLRSAARAALDVVRAQPTVGTVSIVEGDVSVEKTGAVTLAEDERGRLSDA